jgi:23S rRNA pseudouridine1911/1915/1917 synthase
VPSYSGRIRGEASARLDRYVAERLRLLTRSQLKTRLLEARVNGKPVKLSRLLKAGDTLDLSWADPEPLTLTPENIPLEILYEDTRVIVVNKAQGMVVHPGAGNHRGTLANALLHRRLVRGGAGEGGIEGSSPLGLRPGIVHRLDKDTSGVIIAAWDDGALTFLSDQFKNRQARKLYAAIVQGIPSAAEGRIESRIVRDSRDRKRFTVSVDKGKSALTQYRVIRTWPDISAGAWPGGSRSGYSLLLLRPRTGRTHQLRVHLRYLGHPIVGDPIYGAPDPRFPHASLMLHAKSLSLLLPDRDETVLFKAPLPERFRVMMGAL